MVYIFSEMNKPSAIFSSFFNFFLFVFFLLLFWLCKFGLFITDSDLFSSEKPKIGIKAKTGVPLGFVFTETQKTLADFRSLINKEVRLKAEL